MLSFCGSNCFFSFEECVMILGHGVDFVNVSRIAATVERFGDKFLNKIYTDSEIAYCFGHHKNNFALKFAARFAAKEAFSKAVGTGMNSDVTFKNIEILHGKSGAPTIALHGATKRFFENNFQRAKILLSLTDDQNFAFASVIIDSL